MCNSSSMYSSFLTSLLISFSSIHFSTLLVWIVDTYVHLYMNELVSNNIQKQNRIHKVKFITSLILNETECFVRCFDTLCDEGVLSLMYCIWPIYFYIDILLYFESESNWIYLLFWATLSTSTHQIYWHYSICVRFLGIFLKFLRYSVVERIIINSCQVF